MKLLERYIAKTILASIALVTLMLVGLQVFMLFVDQLDSLGKGDYDIFQAASFVFLQTPYQVYLFFPMASLLGCLVGLGIMANHHELVVMRAAGMSTGQITMSVLKAAIIVIALVTVCGETLMPILVHRANDQKMEAMSGGQTLRTAKGVWIRDHNDFFNIGSIQPNNTLEHVSQFHFDDDHHLQMVRKITQAIYAQGAWKAYDIAETRIEENNTRVLQLPMITWDVSLKPGILNVSGNAPDEMTLQNLYHYLNAQKKNHQITQNYQLAFWQRIIQPFTTLVMMLLAIPFIFGPLRSSTIGSKLLLGAMVGFGFYIINRFLGSLSQVYQFPVEIAAMGPACLFALLGLYLMKRIR